MKYIRWKVLRWNDNTFFAWHFGNIYYVTLLPWLGKEVNAYVFNASIHKSKSLVDGLHTFVIIYLNVLHGRIFLSLRMTPDYATLDKLYSTSYFVFWQKLVSVYHDTFLSHVVWTQKADVSNDAMIWKGMYYCVYITKEFYTMNKKNEIYAKIANQKLNLRFQIIEFE